jgi:hypothetical protein
MVAGRTQLVALSLLVATLLPLCTAAAAKPVLYRCDDKTKLAVDYTPRLAQVRWGDRRWTLIRTRGAHAAQYAHKTSDVKLTAQKREASLQVGRQEVRCKFEVQGDAVD